MENITVQQLIEHLQKMVDLHPKIKDFQVIYSHDDEGNEYQRVINLPAICELDNPNQEGYRNLEVKGFFDYGKGKTYYKNCNAICIN